MPEPLFIFMQMEFPWLLGPADGRYLTRTEADGEPERVLVIGTLEPGRAPGAPSAAPGARRGGLLGRLSANVLGVPPEPEPGPVTRTRVTVIDPISLSAESQARAWLADMDVERDIAAAAEVVNRVLHLHRIASADPHVNEVSPGQALVVRAGWGEGEQVASGRWLHARELTVEPTGRGVRRRGGRARTSALRPQERLAALLGARSRTLVCEELTLRARLDLDRGRLRHCAHQLDAALTSAVAELRAEGRHDLAIRVAELEQLAHGVAEQARLALAPEAGDPDEATLTHALQRLESALRARAVSAG
ncbi:MAG TPA: hypothetical protein VII01_11230 [Solirubrobacteraceae bacterium]|jgi:hypothetical protein